MALAVFDIGGTTVKYGLWESETLSNRQHFPTPETWDEMKRMLEGVVDTLRAQATEQITGVAFSSPGSVYTDEGVIRGFSAVPYLHHFPIQQELRDLFGLPVTLENDAYCAALAESWLGSAKGKQNVLFLVIGTGVGGALMVNGELFKGRNMFGGEFGYMLLGENETFSDLGSPVRMAQAFTKAVNAPQPVSGADVFRLAEEGDEVALHHVATLKKNIARGLQNLLVAFNPEMIVIGGGISARPGLVAEIAQLTNGLLLKTNAGDVEVEIVPSEFRNDANLIGAVAAYYRQTN